MHKVGYISLTVLRSVTPEDLGLDENCSLYEFESAAEAHAKEAAQEISEWTSLTVNDIEITATGFTREERYQCI